MSPEWGFSAIQEVLEKVGVSNSIIQVLTLNYLWLHTTDVKSVMLQKHSTNGMKEDYKSANNGSHPPPNLPNDPTESNNKSFEVENW